MKIKKQFIAGAICPNCSDIDSLILFSDDQHIECVSCDFKKSSEQRDIGDFDSSENKPIKSKLTSEIKIKTIDH